MRILIIIMIAFSLLSNGCLAGGAKMGILKPEPFNIEGAGIINIGFSGHQTDGYYVLIEEISENVWKIKKISESPLNIETLNDEILFINKSLNYVQPSFQKWYTIGNNFIHFSCSGTLGHRFSKKAYYNPCDSKLTSYLAWADVYLNKEKVVNIVNQTNLIAKVSETRERIEKEKEECRKLQSIARGFIDKIIVEPAITDKSGFYKGEKIANVSKYIAGNLTCPVDLNDVKYSVSVGTYDNYHFTTNIEPKHYELKYNSEGYFLKPTINIVSKTFSELYPQDIFENQSLSIRLNKIKVNYSGEIEFNINIVNKSDKYISIDLLSFYINNSILTPTLTKIELPPKSFKNDLNFKVSKRIDDKENIFEKAVGAIKVSVTKESAERTMLVSLGVSIKYNIDGIQNTLYKTNSYKLSQIIP